MFRIGDPGLQRSSGPCTDASAQMHRRGKATGRNAPIERRASQGRHPDYIPNSVERRDYVAGVASLIVDSATQIHWRPSGEALPWVPRLRRRLRVGDRLLLRAWRLSPSCSASRAIPSKRRRPTAWLWRLSDIENRRIRHNPAITQRRRLVSRTTSWVHRSSCRGGSRS